MLPNYSGRLLDRILLVALKQTGTIRQNPDEPDYPACRATVVKSLVKAIWKTRHELHEEFRGADVDPPSSKPKP